MAKVLKRFPADVSLDDTTFLTNKKINAELYAYLQSFSYPDPVTHETKVYKKSLPSKKDIAEQVFSISRNTLSNHMKALEEAGFIVDEGDCYVLPSKEKIFFQINLNLLNFFINVVKEPVIKTYIYLG